MSKLLSELFVLLLVFFFIFTASAENGTTFITSPGVEFSVNDASGCQGTTVLVPVQITNAQNGPIKCIIFDIYYDNSVIIVKDIQRGDLTSYWDAPAFNNFAWGTRVAIVYDGITEHGIQDGSSGSVALLNFSVVGTLGSASGMNLSNIQFAGPDYIVRTAQTKNGTFFITEESPEETIFNFDIVGFLKDLIW